MDMYRNRSVDYPTLCLMLESSHNIADLFKSSNEQDFRVLHLRICINFFLILDLSASNSYSS